MRVHLFSLLRIDPRMKNRWILALIFPLALACSTLDICDSDNDSMLIARFKVEVEDTQLDSIVSGLTIYGIREGKSDSLIWNNGSGSRIVLPLDPHNTYSRFVLNVGEVSDTLRIEHKTEAYLTSYTCGFASLFTLREISFTGTIIRSSLIIEALVDVDTEQNEEHLWLYL